MAPAQLMRRGSFGSIAWLLLLTSGCALVGFDPVDAPQAGNSGTAATSASGSGGASGSASPTSGSSGGTTMLGGNGGSSGSAGLNSAGASGAGGMNVADSGTLMGDASTGLPATLPPIGCAGKINGDDCEDGLYCTNNDECSGGVCVPGTAIPCDTECTTGACDEHTDTCTVRPRADGTGCGLFFAFRCMAGVCVSPDGDDCGAGADCQPQCNGSGCMFDCSNANSCNSACTAGAVCDVNCSNAGSCSLDCDAASCDLDCRGADTCNARCDNAAQCVVACGGRTSSGDTQGNCDQVVCENGSACKLLCTAQSCGFMSCWTTEEQCGGGVVACGTSC